MVAAAVALGGCGGDDKKEQYRKDAKAIIDPLRETLNSSDGRVRAATGDRGRIAELDKTRAATVTAARKLEKLDPPKAAADEHQNFVDGLLAFGRDMRALQAAIKEGDRRRARRAVAKLRTDAKNLKTANDALKAELGK